jgi:succinate dehydrogenase flavin-adding protein (antitoxin of CptAB toxin-antitoxin module)
MWIELDKRQCFIDIIDGKIDLWEDDVRIVNFEDEGYIESLCDADISTIKYLLETKDVKLFQKVVDKE